MDKDILDIFYNSIIPEATRGAVDCFMVYHICFNSSIEGRLISGDNPIHYDPPTLVINNRKNFDDLLVTYVNTALEVYDDSFFYDEVLSGEFRTDDNKLCKEKVLMTLLWGNATVEDFDNPCQFLERQIAYLQTNPLTDRQYKGYSNILGGKIITEVAKTRKLSWESPYAFRSYVITENDTHDLPVVRFGIDNDTVYIYSIHQRKNARKSKKVNRNLYKVNENFIEHDNEDLKDITPSSLVALDLFLLHCQSLGLTKYKLVPYLPERWIDKRIMIIKKTKNEENMKVAKYNELMDELSRIQNNLTTKFITTFRRLNYHFSDNFEITSYPFDVDSYLSFNSNDMSRPNNSLFQELSDLYYVKNKTK